MQETKASTFMLKTTTTTTVYCNDSNNKNENGSDSDNNNNNNNNNIVIIIIIIIIFLLFLVTLSSLVFLFLHQVFFSHFSLAFALPFRNAVYSLSLDGKTLGRCLKKNCPDEGL